MSSVDVLVAVRREEAGRYYKNLTAQKEFRVHMVSDTGDALHMLEDRDQHVDVVVLDNGLGHVFEFVSELRHSYPRLLIILVDEEADFGIPGQADEISTEPFNNNDLIRRITRLMSDRQLETLRADSLPAVRQFAKQLRRASGEMGKQQAAVAACKDLGYEYVAFYRVEAGEPVKLALKAQDGPNPIQAVVPRTTNPDDLMTWVYQNRQSRIANPTDTPNFSLVAKGRLGCAACIPVIFSGNCYGVLLACREQPETINQENVLMLELVAAQLSAAISKEIIG
ncbi:MAG: GAF domain-containing protein [Anaerolineae bacterium]|nr:GAF domain-containing protein [Anaerolineae bacterium]